MEPAARFRADLDRLVPEGLAGPLALAVSGGADSMAMLWLAHAALPGRVIAATVDHGLRAGSADEAAAVAGWCAGAGVPHATLRASLAAGNLQAQARAARYPLLRDWALAGGARALATAHHADDQAETFLARAIRGAGPAGLAGVRARRDEGAIAIVRPLLGWRRAELAAVAAAAALPVAHDPSNDDRRFERVRVRQLLATEPLLHAAGLARAARHLGEAEAALEEMADRAWATRTADPLAVDVAGCPRELRRRVARRGLAALSPGADPAVNIEPLLDALEGGRAATQGDVLVTPVGAVWRFTVAPPRR